MKRWSRTLATAALVVGGAVIMATVAEAETWPLELKRLEPLRPGAAARDAPDSVYRTTDPQRFFAQAGSLRFSIAGASDQTTELSATRVEAGRY